MKILTKVNLNDTTGRQFIRKQETGLEHLINKYRIFIISFLIVTDYVLMYFLGQLSSFNFIEEIIGLIIIYGVLFYIHRRTLKDKSKPLLKYFTVIIDYLVVLGCFYEGRDILISVTGITIEQYLLLITTLIIIANIFSVLRLRLGVILFSMSLALLVNYMLLAHYHIQTIIILYTSMIIVLSGFFSWYVSRFIYAFFVSNYKQEQLVAELKYANTEINEQNHELEAQNHRLAQQRDHIQNQNKMITDSIAYASRIQNAVLTSEEEINEIAPNSFVLFKPKDIVSGDFFWFKRLEINNRRYEIVAAVDCTGHGVPGAFMSMLGTAFLNEIISEFKNDFNIATVLNKLRQKVKKQLRQHSSKEIVRDGMDMSICAIDYEEMKLHYSGANSPLYLIRKPKEENSGFSIEDFKPDRMPIGVHLREKDSFTNHIININKGDKVYLFSDGYADQFGGEKGEKFKRFRFRELLISISKYAMDVQKQILEQTLNEWLGNKHKQIDDITIIGVEV